MVEGETKNDVYEYICDEIEKSSPRVIDDVVHKNSNIEVQQSVLNLLLQINGNTVIGQSTVTTPTIKTYRSMATQNSTQLNLVTTKAVLLPIHYLAMTTFTPTMDKHIDARNQA